MKKLMMLMMIAISTATVVIAADDIPAGYRMGIDGELHPLAGRERKEFKYGPVKPKLFDQLDRIEKQVEKLERDQPVKVIPCPFEDTCKYHKTGRNPNVVKNEVRSPVRLWVNDVSVPGLRYYGYYAAVNGGWEFRYSRRDYRAALSNFDSLNPVYNKAVRRNRPSVKVIYEYPY